MTNQTPAVREAEASQAVTTSELHRIPFDAIMVDPDIQQRVSGTSEDVVAEYAHAMSEGAAFPPPIVFSDDGHNYRLADGFHRVVAHRQARPDEKEIECEVKVGGHEDALLFACGANASHGLPRTGADKEKIVLLLLQSEEWCHWSDREIARRCKVSYPFVSKVRAQLETLPDTGQADAQVVADEATTSAAASDPAAAPDDQRSFTRAGKQLTMRTARIGSSRPPTSKTAPPPPSANIRKDPADRDGARMAHVEQAKELVKKMSILLATLDRIDRDMVRRANEPYLDGWFGEDGKLRSTPAELPEDNSQQLQFSF